MKLLLFCIAIVIILATALSICSCTETDQIAFIMNNPSRFNGQTVDINGAVENTIWDSAVSRGAYQVFDGSGDIWVVTDQALPSKGIEVNVKGTLAVLLRSVMRHWAPSLTKPSGTEIYF